MFESFSVPDLAKRAGWKIEVGENGWKNPLSFPTAEAIVYRTTNGRDFHAEGLKALQFAVAKREGGAPECKGMHQLKWGTNIGPADETPLAALLRYLPAGLGITATDLECTPIGTLGPWLWKSTIALHDGQLILTVLEEQAEKETPFYASLFRVDANGLGDGKVSPAFSDLQWMGFEELIARHGGTTTCIYWQIFFMAMECMTNNFDIVSFFHRTWRPGKYVLDTNVPWYQDCTSD